MFVLKKYKKTHKKRQKYSKFKLTNKSDKPVLIITKYKYNLNYKLLLS